MFIYEFPLSPRARTYLKLEQVFKNAELSSDQFYSERDVSITRSR